MAHLLIPEKHEAPIKTIDFPMKMSILDLFGQGKTRTQVPGIQKRRLEMAQPKKYLLTPAGGGAPVWYTEYTLPPNARNKGLKDIAREQLGDEKLFVNILRKIGPENNQGIKWYDEIIPKDRIDPNWTFLLPPAASGADLGKFKIKQRMAVRTSPRIEAGNVFFEGPVETEYTYKKSSKFTDANGLVWVDVTQSNIPRKVSGATYWMCVREGNIARTDPVV